MIKINLIAERKKKKEKKEKKAEVRVPSKLPVAIIGITFITLLGAVALFFYLQSEVSSLKSQSESNKITINDLQKKITETKKYEALNKEINQRSNVIETLRNSQSVPVKILDIVSRKVPEGVWLSALTYKVNAVGLEGYAFTNIEIVSYVENLKKSEDFTDVYLEESKQVEIEKVLVYKFKLRFNVKV
ncbi:MAG: PilN domain-containing protein [Thermodesulfovibrionales bacterium]|nr:PilN domain-containing protein [Thermodesulfovibrionales bacterium]